MKNQKKNLKQAYNKAYFKDPKIYTYPVKKPCPITIVPTLQNSDETGNQINFGHLRTDYKNIKHLKTPGIKANWNKDRFAGYGR